MKRFSKKIMANTAKILRKNIKNGKGYLSYVTMEDMNGKNQKLSKAEYMGLYESQNVFILKNHRYPNYVTLTSTANNPLVMDYQDNGHTCGPTSLSMAIQMLFGHASEKKCAKECGTDSSGTAPDQLIAGAKKLGYQLTKISRNKTVVKNALKKGMPVIAHIQTKPATCLGYVGDYGHYILIYGMTSDGYYYKIADPTKGIKKCKPFILDNATNGRSIHYYRVGIL